MQLVGVSFVLPEVAAEVERAKRHYERVGGCIYCTLVEESVRSGRLVHAGGGFAVIAAHVPRTPLRGTRNTYYTPSGTSGLRDG